MSTPCKRRKAERTFSRQDQRRPSRRACDPGGLQRGKMWTWEGWEGEMWTWEGWGGCGPRRGGEGRCGLGRGSRGDVSLGGLKSSLGVRVVGIFAVGYKDSSATENKRNEHKDEADRGSKGLGRHRCKCSSAGICVGSTAGRGRGLGGHHHSQGSLRQEAPCSGGIWGPQASPGLCPSGFAWWRAVPVSLSSSKYGLAPQLCSDPRPTRHPTKAPQIKGQWGGRGQEPGAGSPPHLHPSLFSPCSLSWV